MSELILLYIPGLDELNQPKTVDGETIPSYHPYIETNEELNLWFEESQLKLEGLVNLYVK